MEPVKHSADPLRKSCQPVRVMLMEANKESNNAVAPGSFFFDPLVDSTLVDFQVFFFQYSSVAPL